MSNATDPRLPEGDERPGSDRSFGYVFAAVFGVISFWPLIHGHGPRWMALGIGAAFGVAAVVLPGVLRPLNYVWFRFGLILHRIVSPLVMTAVFFLCILPIGVLMRAAGKDLLSLKRDAARDSYWIVRSPYGPDPETMKRQF